MSTLLDFSFLVILNLFVMLLWPASGALTVSPDRRSALSIIILVITAIVVFGDIAFLVLKITGH